MAGACHFVQPASGTGTITAPSTTQAMRAAAAAASRAATTCVSSARGSKGWLSTLPLTPDACSRAAASTHVLHAMSSGSQLQSVPLRLP